MENMNETTYEDNTSHHTGEFIVPVLGPPGSSTVEAGDNVQQNDGFGTGQEPHHRTGENSVEPVLNDPPVVDNSVEPTGMEKLEEKSKKKGKKRKRSPSPESDSSSSSSPVSDSDGDNDGRKRFRNVVVQWLTKEQALMIDLT